MAHEVEGTAASGGAIARRVAFVTGPLRILVNTPRLLVPAVLAVWVLCCLAYSVLEDKGPIEG